VKALFYSKSEAQRTGYKINSDTKAQVSDTTKHNSITGGQKNKTFFSNS